MKIKGIEMWAWWLVVIGAINWGLVGLGSLLGAGNWNLVEMVFGKWLSMAGVTNLVYVLVGASGLWLLWEKMGK